MAFSFFIDDVESIKEKVLAFKYVTPNQIKDLAKEFSNKNQYCLDHKIKLTDI